MSRHMATKPIQMSESAPDIIVDEFRGRLEREGRPQREASHSELPPVRQRIDVGCLGWDNARRPIGNHTNPAGKLRA